MSQIRGDYKSVWTALSGSKEDAYMVVSGYTDEEKFHADAEDTLYILRETTGIQPTDTFWRLGVGWRGWGGCCRRLCRSGSAAMCRRI